MSSNIRVIRVCEFCSTEFEAKTTRTKMCSHKCSKAKYKAKKRGEKIELSNIETLLTKNQAINDVQDKEVLTVKDVSLFIGCSVDTVYRLIEDKKLKAVNLGERITRITRTELNRLFEWQQK